MVSLLLLFLIKQKLKIYIPNYYLTTMAKKHFLKTIS